MPPATTTGRSTVALIANPMGELTGPLHRMESALTQLCGDLEALYVLPGVHAGVDATNGRLERVERELALTRATSEQMAATLEAIRGDLGELVRLLGGDASQTAGRRKPRTAAAKSTVAAGEDG
jgi:hypothetical protein